MKTFYLFILLSISFNFSFSQTPIRLIPGALKNHVLGETVKKTGLSLGDAAILGVNPFLANPTAIPYFISAERLDPSLFELSPSHKVVDDFGRKLATGVIPKDVLDLQFALNNIYDIRLPLNGSLDDNTLKAYNKHNLIEIDKFGRKLGSKEGITPDDVKKLQTALNFFYSIKLPIDGLFRNETLSAYNKHNRFIDQLKQTRKQTLNQQN